ncbi:hypothetical protein BMS3Bbin04_01661 [bacterium BMS3Bbin04]|nr:hypothetical protein BMS3Bbin04_01661 [bacterium BMS3Bbin04]
MIELYLNFVKAQPILSSAVQVAILGTFGELLAIRIRTGKWYLFGPGPWRLMTKVAVWAFLGITFKYAFVGFFGFVDALILKGFWFEAAREGIVRAFSVSVFTNLLFGPVMMLFHRWTDNAIEAKPMHWPSLQNAWKTLLWFWIPAHTLTFSLPSHLQVGLAAVWAVALGVILGSFNRD